MSGPLPVKYCCTFFDAVACTAADMGFSAFGLEVICFCCASCYGVCFLVWAALLCCLPPYKKLSVVDWQRLHGKDKVIIYTEHLTLSV